MTEKIFSSIIIPTSRNRRVPQEAHQRAGTEWKSGGNIFREAHLGEVFLKSVGKIVEPALRGREVGSIFPATSVVPRFNVVSG